VPAGKIRGVLGAIEAATSAGRDPRVTVQHPSIGALQLIGSPIRTAGLEQPTAPPLLGQHSEEVLAELGVEDTEFEALKQRGVVA
jgi:crotonobetainyl-CoA:carnitine CoA-transferase CaiB-like acyl-CoA transferase